VTFVTGWHGAGASTLADRLAADLAPLAVEVVRSEEEVVEKVAGCSACAVRHDLVRVVGNLASRWQRPDRIVVDVGGWSDVVVAAQTFLDDPDLRRRTELCGIVTAVDTPSAAMRALSGQPVWPSDTCGEQVAAADHVVLTSTGAATEEGREAARWVVCETNTAAAVSDEALLRPTDVVGGRAFGWDAAARLEGMRTVSQTLPGITTAAAVVEAPGNLDVGRVHAWVKGLHHVDDGRLLRIRGVIGIAGCDNRLLCQGVGTSVEFETGEPWGTAPPVTRLLVSGRGLERDALGSSLQECSSA